jgi:phage repressor protein C with HTH and peptisase S24 domain
VRRDDRVLVKAKGAWLVMRFARRTAKKIELKSLNPSQPDRTFDRNTVELMARIVWARH